MSTLTLEVGQSYRTKSGKRVTIRNIIKSKSTVYPQDRYMGTDNGAYTVHGIPLPPLYTVSSLAIAQDPLVARYHDPDGVEKPKPMIKVGGFYPSEAGILVKITQTLFLARGGNFDSFEVYVGDNKSLYTPYGRMIPRFPGRSGVSDEIVADLVLNDGAEAADSLVPTSFDNPFLTVDIS